MLLGSALVNSACRQVSQHLGQRARKFFGQPGRKTLNGWIFIDDRRIKIGLYLPVYLLQQLGQDDRIDPVLLKRFIRRQVIGKDFQLLSE
ncbi:hypothetical protein D3C72_1455780 [compost metagenome]